MNLTDQPTPQPRRRIAIIAGFTALSLATLAAAILWAAARNQEPRATIIAEADSLQTSTTSGAAVPGETTTPLGLDTTTLPRGIASETSSTLLGGTTNTTAVSRPITTTTRPTSTSTTLFFVSSDYCAPFGDFFSDYPNPYFRRLWDGKSDGPFAEWEVNLAHSRYVEMSSGGCPDPRVEAKGFRVSSVRLAFRVTVAPGSCSGRQFDSLASLQFSLNGTDQNGASKPVVTFGDCATGIFFSSEQIWTSSFGWNPATPKDRNKRFWIRLIGPPSSTLDSGWILVDLGQP